MFDWLKRVSNKIDKVGPQYSDSHHLNVKASKVSSIVACNTLGSPVWTPRRYDKLADEGYQKNVIVYRAVNLISRGAASVPWRLYNGREEIHEHEILDLLHSPNPRQAGSAFVESVLGYLLLAGNSYIEAVMDDYGNPAELYSHRPDRMKVIPGRSGIPVAYEYEVNGQKRTMPVDGENGASTVLHLKFFHPLNDWYGLSPIETAACSIDQHNAVASHNLALLQNGGRPSGALMVGKSGDKMPLTTEQREILKQDVQDLYEGNKNAGRVMVLEGEFEWKEMGLSPKDLDFIEGRNLSAREIAQAYNVPPMLVGIPGDATYSNYKEARLHLWEDTILPLLDYFTDELNLWLVNHYGRRLRLTYDIDGIPALAKRREDAWAKIQAASFLTVNEKRQAVGYEPIEGGDTL